MCTVLVSLTVINSLDTLAHISRTIMHDRLRAVTVRAIAAAGSLGPRRPAGGGNAGDGGKVDPQIYIALKGTVLRKANNSESATPARAPDTSGAVSTYHPFLERRKSLRRDRRAGKREAATAHSMSASRSISANASSSSDLGRPYSSTSATSERLVIT